MIHNGRKADAANAAQICDGESSTFHIGGGQFFVTRLLGELRQLDRQFDDVLLVDIADHGDEQAAIGVSSNANINVLLVDNFFFVDVDAGVELRKNFERRGADFQRDGSDRHLATGFFGFGGEAGSQVFEFGDVGAVVLRDVWNRVPGFGKVLGGFTANAAH